LGEVEISPGVSAVQMEQLKTALLSSGFELLENNKAIIIERIKNAVVEMVHYNDDLPKTNFSDYLSSRLNYSYTYLANVFSDVKGTTIEHFIIKHKIERIKELLEYDELTLTEISFKLHYSSISHLSNQFKKVTGITPSDFKKQKHRERNKLEDL
jgi:AraC-like DNA-binding protein